MSTKGRGGSIALDVTCDRAKRARRRQQMGSFLLSVFFSGHLVLYLGGGDFGAMLYLLGAALNCEYGCVEHFSSITKR